MKTFIRKDGKKFNISNALYEVIMRKGILEDATANPITGTTGRSKQNKGISLADAYRPQIEKALQTAGVPNTEINDILIKDISNNINPNTFDPSKIQDYVNEYIKKTKTKIDSTNGNGVVEAKVKKYLEEFGYEFGDENKDDAVIKYILRYVDEHNIQNEEELKKIVSHVAKENTTVEGMSAYKYETYKKTLSEIVMNHIKNVLRTISSEKSSFGDFNRMMIKQIKSMTDNDNNINYDEIHIGNDVVNSIFTEDNAKELAEKIAVLIIKNNKEIVNRANDSGIIMDDDYSRGSLFNYMVNSDDKKEFGSDVYDRFINICVYNYIHDRINNSEFINQLVSQNNDLPAKWINNEFIKNFF